MTVPTALRFDQFDQTDFLFDLRGYVILRGAVDKAHVRDLNAALDAFPPLEFGQWHGRVQRFDNNGECGVELQNIVEGGAPFERLIDHPAWIDRLHRYCGEPGTFVDGLFIDECFASIRRTGGWFGFHSGGYEAITRTQYRFSAGKFSCGQVNILLALTDIGPGDGGTAVIPGSHKSNFPHPQLAGLMTNTPGSKPLDPAIEVHLQAGDALMFCDALCHGATRRENPGERRVVIYRYGPSWGNTRHGYRYGQELFDRLTPARRRILEPVPPRTPASAPAPHQGAAAKP
jgi:hypothetical protein